MGSWLLCARKAASVQPTRKGPEKAQKGQVSHTLSGNASPKVALTIMHAKSGDEVRGHARHVEVAPLQRVHQSQQRLAHGQQLGAVGGHAATRSQPNQQMERTATKERKEKKSGGSQNDATFGEYAGEQHDQRVAVELLEEQLGRQLEERWSAGGSAGEGQHGLAEVMANLHAHQI